MNKFFLLTLIVVSTIPSCKKEKNEAVYEKKILLPHTCTAYTDDGSAMLTEYTCNDAGRIDAELEDKGTANEQLITYLYDSKGNIAAKESPDCGSLRTEYTYDNMNRMVAAQSHSEDFSKGEASAYTYYNDRIEELSTFKSGRSAKRVFTYTADKKNIGYFKMYDINGLLWADQTYIHAHIKEPLRNVNPPTLYNASIHLVEKTGSVDYDDPANPITDTYTYTAPKVPGAAVLNLISSPNENNRAHENAANVSKLP